MKIAKKLKNTGAVRQLLYCRRCRQPRTVVMGISPDDEDTFKVKNGSTVWVTAGTVTSE